jgi:hypothetical protein
VQLDVAIALFDRLLGARRDLLGIAVLQQAGIGRQLVAARAAQQPMQRQAGCLAGDVPQRDVEARQREDRDAVAPNRCSFCCRSQGGRCRVLPTRGAIMLSGGAHRVAAVAERLAPADQAIGLDLTSRLLLSSRRTARWLPPN